MEKVIETYSDMLFRLCLVMLGNYSDAEDAVQETFIKYIRKSHDFDSHEKERSWLFTVAANTCRDMLRYRKRHPADNIDSVDLSVYMTSDSGILDALMTLPDKFKEVLVLYYVEDCNVKDIANIIGKSESAVKMRLQKGRRLLKEAYRKE